MIRSTYEHSPSADIMENTDNSAICEESDPSK